MTRTTHQVDDSDRANRERAHDLEVATAECDDAQRDRDRLLEHADLSGSPTTQDVEWADAHVQRRHRHGRRDLDVTERAA